MSFLGRIVDWINRLYPFKKEHSEDRKTNFEAALKKGIDEDRDDIVSAVNLCDEALDIVADRIVMINRQKDVEERIAEVAAYGSLSSEDVTDLKEMLDRYTNMSKESNHLKYQVTSFDPALAGLGRLQESAANAVPEIKFAEERQRIFKVDIGHLEGEKIVLEHGRERIKNAIDFVYKFSIALLIFFALILVVLVYIYIMHNVQTMVVLAGLLTFGIVLTGLLYWLRQKLRYELVVNRKKQQRAVELLNKKKANYAHFTNFLNHSYRKYQVRNSKMLESNLEDYAHYKHMTKRLDALRNIMNQTEEAIETFLRYKGITTTFGSIEKFAATVNLDDKVHYHKELERELELIERSLKRLDTRSAQIWQVLSQLKASSKESAVIGAIMDDYVVKAERLMERDANFGTTLQDFEGIDGEMSTEMA
ncbi:MAG: hypothetical protein FWE33_00455 [Defluviitaleaceae bacterium]|nr:hypothetical protein [Defluviitaleaceae bacterium]